MRSRGVSKATLIELFGPARGAVLAQQSPYSQHLAVRAVHCRRPVVASVQRDGLVAAVQKSPNTVPTFS